MRSTIADTLPPKVRRSRDKLGGDLAIARKKRSLTTAMMAERLGVAKCTYLRTEKGESATFEYNPDWLAAAERFAVDPALPLVTGPQFHRKTRDGSVFHPAIADTEPDGWGGSFSAIMPSAARKPGGLVRTWTRVR